MKIFIQYNSFDDELRSIKRGRDKNAGRRGVDPHSD